MARIAIKPKKGIMAAKTVELDLGITSLNFDNCLVLNSACGSDAFIATCGVFSRDVYPKGHKGIAPTVAHESCDIVM
jgi:hypothetical protein